MKAKLEKCHLLTTEEEKEITVIGDKIKNNTSEKLLGITIDCKLNLNKHANKICVKASQKIKCTCKSVVFHVHRKKKGNYKSTH